MYCTVARSFQNPVEPFKNGYVFKCDNVKNLKYGDVVEVETKNGLEVGVVNKFFEEDNFNYHGLFRTNVVKKVHGNTIKAAVRTRFERFADVTLPAKDRKATAVMKGLVKRYGMDYRYHVLLALTLGNICKTVDGNLRIVYDDIVYFVREGANKTVIVNFYKARKKYKWVNAIKGVEEFNKLYLEKYGVLPKEFSN
jgi:hypothetical protein